MAPTIAFAILAFSAALVLIIVLLEDGGPQRIVASIFETIGRAMDEMLWGIVPLSQRRIFSLVRTWTPIIRAYYEGEAPYPKISYMPRREADVVMEMLVREQRRRARAITVICTICLSSKARHSCVDRGRGVHIATAMTPKPSSGSDLFPSG